MSFIEIFLIAVSLALDAVVVSVGAGALVGMNKRGALKIALYFGAFQAAMPLIGYLAGLGFREYVATYGHIIGFLLLLAVGLKMLWETFKKEDVEAERHIMSTRTLTLLAVATSIDALVIGITFNFVPVHLPVAIAVIGVVTFVLSYMGVLIGKRSRHLLGTKFEIVGAVILIGLAFKVLLFS